MQTGSVIGNGASGISIITGNHILTHLSQNVAFKAAFPHFSDPGTVK